MPQLISVIIPCYNHGNYLEKAIESVLAQSYRHFELIVVDDGSIDCTKEVAQKYTEVSYIYQVNQGLSAARNTGIEVSTGELIVFLDADDWLVPDALSINLNYLNQHPGVAFVSGAYEIFYEWINERSFWQKKLTETPYCHLLEKNFIGMHGTVLFKRWVFELFRYDTSLKSCEDYDLYLKIARKFEVFVHQELIAVYYFHQSNMSSNYAIMLKNALFVLNKQKTLLKNKTEKTWFKKGISFWKSYYSQKMFEKISYQLYDKNSAVLQEDVKNLKQYNTYLYLKFIFYATSKQKLKLLVQNVSLFQTMKGLIKL